MSAQCFYPNGDPSKENDIPCGSGAGVQCCPSGWTCQINGLCYLADQKYLGRYTCTDRSWKSAGCPQICTHNNTANGNEAVLECSSGNFCCDANRPELSGGQACCDASPSRFSIDGNVAMTAMSNAPASATATIISSAAATTSARAAGQSSSTSTSPSSQANSNSAPLSSQTTDSLNPTSVVLLTSVLNQTNGPTATNTSTVDDPSSHGPNHAAIIGGSIAGLVALITIAVLSFLLLRRRRREPKTSPLFRGISLKDNLDSMYHDRRSLKSLFKSDAPSELAGSVPDLNVLEMNEKDWGKRYEGPGDVGRFKSLAAPQRSSDSSTRHLTRLSSESHELDSGQGGGPVELPGDGSAKTQTPR